MTVIEKSLNVEQMAEILCVTKLAIYEAVKRGDIPHFRVGKHIRFDTGSVRAWMARMWMTHRSAAPQYQPEVDVWRNSAPPGPGSLPLPAPEGGVQFTPLGVEKQTACSDVEFVADDPDTEFKP